MRGSKAKAIRRKIASLGYENRETVYREIKHPPKYKFVQGGGDVRYNPIQRVLESFCFRGAVQAYKRDLRAA